MSNAPISEDPTVDYERIWYLTVQHGVQPLHAGKKVLQRHPDLQRRLGHAWADLAALLGGHAAAAQANPALLRAVRGEEPPTTREK